MQQGGSRMSKFRSNIPQFLKEKTLLRIGVFYQPLETRMMVGRLMEFNEREDYVTLYLDDRKSFLYIYIKHIVTMDMLPIFELVQMWIKETSLLQVKFTQSRKGTRALFGRIIQMDDSSGNILFYDVDAKMVNNISMNELDDIREEQKSLTEKTEKLIREMTANREISYYKPISEPDNASSPQKPASSAADLAKQAELERQAAMKAAAEAAKVAEQKAAEAAKMARKAEIERQNALEKAAEEAKAAAKAAAAEKAANEKAAADKVAAERAANDAAAKAKASGQAPKEDPSGRSVSQLVNQKGHLKASDAVDDVDIDLSHLSVQEEMQLMISKLSPQDLYPLLPLLRYVVKETKKRDAKKLNK